MKTSSPEKQALTNLRAMRPASDALNAQLKADMERRNAKENAMVPGKGTIVIGVTRVQLTKPVDGLFRAGQIGIVESITEHGTLVVRLDDNPGLWRIYSGEFSVLPAGSATDDVLSR